MIFKNEMNEDCYDVDGKLVPIIKYIAFQKIAELEKRIERLERIIKEGSDEKMENNA